MRRNTVIALSLLLAAIMLAGGVAVWRMFQLAG